MPWRHTMEEESKVGLTRSRGNKRLVVMYNFFQSQGFSFKKMGSAPFHFPREKPVIFAAIVLQVVASADVTFQLPPPLDDRFRTFLAVLFSSVASVMSAFIILSMPWSVLRSSFSEDSTSAHCTNSRFSRLFISSLSPFLLDLFPSTTSFLRRSPRNRTPLWRNRQLYWKGSLLFRSVLCWSHFLQTLFTHKMLRWRYEEDLKQILPGTFTIIIK